MDAIEQAHQRYERNKANRERVAAKKAAMAANPQPVLPPIVRPEPQVPVLLVPKEKTQDAYIEVRVTLPSKSFSFVLRKRNVLNNMNPSKATQMEFEKAIKTGLATLLGAVD